LDTYHVVLYAHLVALFIGIGAGSVLLTCLFQLRAASTLEQAAPWGMTAGKVAKLFPVAVVGLFATGAYMTSKLWTWDTGWIDVSIAGLALVALQGPLVGDRTAHKLKAALQANGPGALGEAARKLTVHPGLWVTELSNLGVVLAIVWNMTQKPSTATSIVALAVGYAVGAMLALRLGRLPAPAEEAVTQPG
jgi:hypothetical protein